MYRERDADLMIADTTTSTTTPSSAAATGPAPSTSSLPCSKSTGKAEQRRKCSANILNLLLPTLPRPEIGLQHPVEHFHEHLKAYPGNRGIISAFAQLVADECVYNYVSPLSSMS